MPKIGQWENFPEGVGQHLIDRMRERAISIADLNRLRLWIDTSPEVPSPTRPLGVPGGRFELMSLLDFEPMSLSRRPQTRHTSS